MSTSTTAAREEIAQRGKLIYQELIRPTVETEANTGRMVIIDVDTGTFAVEDEGISAAYELRLRNPQARLYGIRIGYNVAESLGGVMERVTE